MPLEIFCCYSRKDRLLLNNLISYLAPLQREEFITVWADVDIGAGVEWEKEIVKHLNSAHIILLLVSPDFIVSDYCYTKEMRRALERHELREARVIPVILHPCLWQTTPLSKLQALPADGKPVTSWKKPRHAYVNVAEGIRKVVEELLVTQPLAVEPEQKLAVDADRDRQKELALALVEQGGIPLEIRFYLNDLLTQAGMVSVDSVMREAMIEELYVRLDKYLTIKILDYLPTEKLEEFADLTEENPSQEEIQKYIEANVPNAQDIFLVAFGEFRDLYLKGLQENTNQILGSGEDRVEQVEHEQYASTEHEGAQVDVKSKLEPDMEGRLDVEPNLAQNIADTSDAAAKPGQTVPIVATIEDASQKTTDQPMEAASADIPLEPASRSSPEHLVQVSPPAVPQPPSTPSENGSVDNNQQIQLPVNSNPEPKDVKQRPLPCGHLNRSSARFCSICGKPASPQVPPLPAPQPAVPEPPAPSPLPPQPPAPPVTPPFTGTALSTPPPHRLSTTRKVVRIVVALLVILAGVAGLVYAGIISANQASINAKATATATANASSSANAATATASTLAEQQNMTATAIANVDPYPPYTGTLAFSDPLNNNSQGNQWDEYIGGTGDACQFTDGDYHASETQATYFASCFARSPSANFSNFAFEVQMTIIKGDGGGILFRADRTSGKFYYFAVYQDGTYALYLYMNYAGTNARILTSGSSPAIKQGIDQNLIIAILANGDTITLYAKQQPLASVNDSTYSSGQIALIADDHSNPAEVVYSNARAWMLS